MNEEHATLCLSALGNPTRIRLFRLLMRAGSQGLNVGEVQKLLETPASTLAHHIAALSKADLLLQRRKGREVFCYANYNTMNATIDYLTEACCAGVDVGEETTTDASA